MVQLPLRSTLFFAVSGNPIAFNHFAAAEALLRNDPGLERVVFVLSNGIHPDPTKPDAEVSAKERLELLEQALSQVADPAHSALARQAELRGDRLRIGPERIGISTHELACTRAVRTAETVAALRAERPEEPEPVRWLAGSDLLRRMTDPRIFSDEDLAYLARECELTVLERGEPTGRVREAVERTRGVRLRCREISRAGLPDWIAFFLRLSSTHVRRAAEAGDPLGGMLPEGPAARLVERGLYREGRPAARLVALDGTPLATHTELDRRREALEEEVAAAAASLAERLEARRARGLPHGLAIAETSAGGCITAALAGRSGASHYLRQGRLVYDRVAKAALIGPEADRQGVVSEGMVRALAESLLREAGADLAIAETGMAGPPDGRHRSLKNGECWLAFATPDGTHTEHLALDPFATRREHQLRFAARALAGLAQTLDPAER